jgi:2OG-Fe(II) oxygenase superfamily
VIVTYSVEGGLKVEIKPQFSDLMNKLKLCSGMVGDEYMGCIKQRISGGLSQLHAAVSTVKSYRDMMALSLRNYTCHDDNLESSPAARSMAFMHDDVEYQLDVLLEMTNAKIWTVSNFISDDECNILMEQGRPKMVSAVVADSVTGKPVLNEGRKAKQASYAAPGDFDPLLALKKKVLALTNSFAGYNLDLPGQEELTIIQYNKNDHYAPHCDGLCDGTKYKSGGRVASAIMYCHVAEKGGGTTFAKSNIFVKPVKGLATFMSYKGPDGTMDDSYTEHSGCPVLEGEKWLTTLWMREGLTAQSPWSHYDPHGIPYNRQTNSFVSAAIQANGETM